jgi:hypothetical protein
MFNGAIMAIIKRGNLLDQVSEYNENFVKSISLKGIKDSKDLRELMFKLEKANDIITEYYNVLYNDYIMMINSDYCFNPSGLDASTVIKYHNLAKKIHKLYNYVVYIATFENPFK